jgi:hypothetical protein
MLENIIIFLAVFLIVLWLQHNDDLRFKNSKKRIVLYEMIKLPLFVAALVLLFKNMNYRECFNEISSIFIIPSIPNNNNISSINDVFNNIYSEQPDF